MFFSWLLAFFKNPRALAVDSDHSAKKVVNRVIPIGDYQVHTIDDELFVGGPHEAVCDAIRQRLSPLCGREEFGLLIGDPEATYAITEMFGCYTSSKDLEPATQRQREYATSVGYKIDDGITRAEIGFLLSDYENVRNFIHDICRFLKGASCTDLGIPKTCTAHVAQLIVKDRTLRSRILFAKAYRLVGDRQIERNARGQFKTGSSRNSVGGF